MSASYEIHRCCLKDFTGKLVLLLQVVQGKLQKTEDKADELKAALKETEANLIAKVRLTAHCT